MVAVIALAGVAGSARGQELAGTNTSPAEELSSYYHAQELSIDAFASGSLGKQYIDHITGRVLRHDARFGAGVGANYFFTRYLGVGGDVYSESTRGDFIGSAEGNLIARLPIDAINLAPYVFGGAGHQFEQVQQTFGQAGLGVEWRVAPHIGFFVDARYVYADKTENYGVARGGMRLSF
jgi:hypothetical protein